MEAASQVATNAKTVTNIPRPPHTSGTTTPTEDEDLHKSDQLPASATAKDVNNVMVKSVTTAGSGSPAVGGAGSKVISSAAKAASVAAAEALKSGNVKIAHSHLNATKLMSGGTNHTGLGLNSELEDSDMTAKVGRPSTPVAKGAVLQQLNNFNPPVSNNVANNTSDCNTIKKDQINNIPSLVSSQPPSSIVVPPLAPSSNDEGLDDSHSGDEDHPDLIKLKPPRPPRKKVKETLKEPLYEEDIIEGFSFAAFKTYEDLEKMAKWSSQHNGKYPDPYSKLKFNDEKKKEKKKKKNKNRDREHNRENKILSQIDSNANKCDSDSEGEKETERNRVGHGDLLKSRKVGNVCQQNGLSGAPSSAVPDTSAVSSNVKSPCGTNIPIPNSSVGFSVPYPNIPQGVPATALPNPSASHDGSGLSHFGSPIASSPLKSNSLTSPLGVHHPLTSTPKSSLSSPNQSSSSITNVASAPSALAAPTQKPKGFFRPYSTSPTPPKLSDSESQNASSASDNFNAPPPRQSPFSYSQHPAYRLPNTTTSTALGGGLIPHPGAIPTSFNGIRNSSYFPLDHNRAPPHHFASAASISPFAATSGYPEYSIANSSLNNNSPYYPNYPGRSLNGPFQGNPLSSALQSMISTTASSLGYNHSSALVQPNHRPVTGLSNAVAPYHPPPEVNGAFSSAKTTVPCSTSTSTVPSHHQDLSSKFTHSQQSSLSHNSRPTSAPSSQSSAKVAQSWSSPILSATPSPSSSIRSSFPSPSLSLTTPPGPGTPHSGVLPPPVPGLRLPASTPTSTSAVPTNTVPPSPLASTLAPDPTAGTAPIGAASRADILRRELDSRFLATQDRSGVSGGPSGTTGAGGFIPQPFLHTEMHHHQHQHTHIHQHNSPSTSNSSSVGIPPTSASPSIGLPPTPGLHGSLMPPIPGLPPSLIPPAGASSFLTNPMMKEGPKIGGANSMFYRAPGFPEFSALGIPRPPDHLRNGAIPPTTSFMPPTLHAPLTPKKTGKWNAMHVRIAWEIYNHQQKQKSESKEKSSSSSSVGTSPSSTKSSTTNSASHTSTTSISTAGTNPSSLSTPPAGSKSSSSDVLGRAPPTGASDLPNSKPSPADLLRAGAHGTLFPPGIPRPPTDPFGLIRPPYPGPSLFGPSHLESALSPFPRYGSSTIPFGGLGSLRGPTPIHPPLSAVIPPSAIKPDPFNLSRAPGLSSSQTPSTTPSGIPPGWPTLSSHKSDTDIKKDKERSETEERERREKQREREKRQQRSIDVKPLPTGPDGTLPQYLATMGVKNEVVAGDRKRDVSRSPVRSIHSGSPGPRSNTSSVAPADIRSVESASVSPLVKRESIVPNDSRPLSASNNNKDKGVIGSVSGNSDTSHQNNAPSHHRHTSGLSSRSTSANDLSSAVKKEDVNEITVIGEKGGLLNGRPSRSSLSNHAGLARDHHHTTNLHGGHIKTDSPSRHHGSASSFSSIPGGGNNKLESRRPLSNPSRDSNSVKPPSISQGISLASASPAIRCTSSELFSMQQQAAAVSIASSMATGMPYQSLPGFPPPGYHTQDPRTAAALALFPGLSHRPGAVTPFPPGGGFGAPGMFPPGLDPFRDHYLAAAAMGAAASNPYLKDPLREAREREMIRMNPLGSMIMSEHDRARMALGYPPGLLPHSAASQAGLYGMSAALAAGAAKIPPPLGTPGAGTALGAPPLGMYSSPAGFPPHSALAGLGIAGAGVPGLTPPLTPTVNGHGHPSSTAASPALSRDHHPLAR